MNRAPTPQQQEEFLARLKIEKERRERAGEWQGAIVADVAYQHRPIDWIVEKLEIPRERLQWSLSPEYADHDWDGTTDPLVAIAEALAGGQDVGCESGTGTGKTFFAACLILWFLACHEDAIVPTIAPKEDQLLKAVWKELGRLWGRFTKHFPNAEMQTGVIRMRPKVEDRETWAAFSFVAGVGKSEDVATRAQGLMHAEHMLIVTEETPGIHSAIMVSLRETRTDDHNLQLALGNPDHQQDELHKFCKLTNTVAIRMSALDHPNVVTGRRIVPGAIGKKRLADRTKDLGVGTDLYNRRVRGISPPESEKALIRRSWLEAAARLWEDPAYREGEEWRGVDVSDAPDGDPAAIARGRGAWCSEVWADNVEDGAYLGDMVADEVRREHIDPRYVGLDVAGVGATTKNQLKRRGLRVRHIWGSGAAIPGLDVDSLWSTVTPPDEEGQIRPTGPKVVESEEYDQLRSQVYWKLREDIRNLRFAIPWDEELFDELTAHQWDADKGKISVASKAEVTEVLGHSPNKADALAYGNFVRKRTKTPPRAGAPEPETTPAVNPRNVDTGLEKKLHRLGKRQAQERKRLERILRARHRGG